MPPPINWHYTAEEATYILRDCDAKVVVIHSDLLPPIQDSIPDGVLVVVVPTPDEIAAAYGVNAAVDLPEGAVLWSDFIADREPWTELPPASRGTHDLYLRHHR